MGDLVTYRAISAIAIFVVGIMVWALFRAPYLTATSLFNRLFIIVAITSAFFSAVSSAIGFGLLTSQESDDLFRNYILPPAFGVFVFFVAVAIWVGGAELVRNRDWFRSFNNDQGTPGIFADLLFFFERCVKLFILIPILAIILFFVSTWTSVVGIAGVDAVRYTYNQELSRLQTDCSGIIAFRANDQLFIDDLGVAIRDVKRAAQREQESGGQTGLRGKGATADYINGVAQWLSALEESALKIIEDDKARINKNPYEQSVCARKVNDLRTHLSRNAFENYDLWARTFETDFENFRLTLNTWRLDRRLLLFIEQQLANFDRANPKPFIRNTQNGSIQANVIEQYSSDVTDALKSLVRKQKLRKPPKPLLSDSELSPERGLEILTSWFNKQKTEATLTTNTQTQKPRSRSRAVVESETIKTLSIVGPRDAVLKNAQVFSDVWALALAWDYASYILLFVFLLFPSAERSARYKD